MSLHDPHTTWSPTAKIHLAPNDRISYPIKGLFTKCLVLDLKTPAEKGCLSVETYLLCHLKFKLIKIGVKERQRDEYTKNKTVAAARGDFSHKNRQVGF